MRSTEDGVVLESIVVVLQEHDGDEGTRTPGTTATASSEAPVVDVSHKPSWLQRNLSRIFGMVSKVAAVASLVLAALMAWPAITSSADTRLATLLAEWTSENEYMEFCEAVCLSWRTFYVRNGI